MLQSIGSQSIRDDLVTQQQHQHFSAIKKNNFESVLVRWMNLEPIIQSKVSQKEKKQMRYINAYIWNLEKK